MEREGRSAKDGGDTRREKRKSNSSLHRLYSVDKSIASSSSAKARTSRQRTNSSANTSAIEQEKTITAQQYGSTSSANANLPLGIPSQADTRSVRQPKETSALHSAANLSTASTSNLLAPNLDDINVVPSPYDTPMLMVQSTSSPSSSFHVVPSFPYAAHLSRLDDTDNSSYPFPTIRLPPSGQGGVQEPQIFGQGYQSGYPSVISEPHRSIGSRRNWLQQTQQQQYQQPQQHHQAGTLGTELPYSQQSLHPSHSTILSDQQRPSSAFAAHSFSSSGVGSSNVGHETPSMMGMTDASYTLSQSNPDGQQSQYQDASGHGQGSIGPVTLQRTNEYRPENSDPSSLGSSEWSTLPNLRLLRGMQGDLLSSSSSGSQLSAPSEHGKRKQSRAHLQRHLRSLQNEMVALKEKVRVAEGLYRETSPDEQQSTSDASSSKLYDSTLSRKSMYNFDTRDYRGNERTNQSSNEAMVESSGSAYSSSFSGHPASTSKQLPYNSNPSQTPSSTSSVGALPPRRGTWKTGSGNVLVYNTAVASDTENTSTLPRAASYSEQNITDEGDDDEDEDMGMRGAGIDDTGKRYQCLVPGCLKSFTTSGHARRHSRTHLGHKLFVCPHDGCDSTFTRRDNCRQHQRARHHMTLPVPELSEGETLENLILDRQQTSGGQRSSSSHQGSRSANTTL